MKNHKQSKIKKINKILDIPEEMTGNSLIKK